MGFADMSFRLALLAASAAVLAAPLAAQDHPLEPLEDSHAAAPADPAHAEHGHAMHARHHAPVGMTTPSGVRLAYTAEQRAQWLADCRTVMRGEEYYYYDQSDNRNDGDQLERGLLGGLIGAVVGGLVGNRIDNDDSSRLGGTLIGAGVGGLAGAAIGGLLGEEDGDDRYHESSARAADAYAADYCDAYLRQYENGAGSHAQMVYAQPMMLVPVAAAPHHEREIVREEWVEEPEARPARRAVPARRRAPAPRGKLTEIR